MDHLSRFIEFPKKEDFDRLNVVKTPLFTILEPIKHEESKKKNKGAKRTSSSANASRTKKMDTFKKGGEKNKTNGKGGGKRSKKGDAASTKEASNFMREQIEDDLKPGNRWNGHVIRTRFPPEPNGYLHLGHAKSICLNFGLAKTFGGHCHLRMDDTNPTTEKTEYIESIKRDVKWLGADWGQNFFHASDYFEKLYSLAVILVKKGLAYVDDQSKEEMDKTKGTVTEKGTNSPYRNRSVEENLKLLEKMKNGDFPDGHCTLRAKIDMGHPQPCMRDPLMYRIRRNSPHPHTGTKWKIYPLYDFAHGLSDAIEGISHSICTLEFVPRRELYDWFVNNVGDAPCLPKGRPRPKQWEMSRLNLNTVTLSKRRLIKLVDGGHVEGWDDPRMPTISGARRAGIPPAAIREFCRRVGVTKSKNFIELAQWKSAIRDTLDGTSARIMGVVDPLKVVITNMPEDAKNTVTAPFMPANLLKNAPEHCRGTRTLSFGKCVYIEKEDFSEAPPKGWKRLSVGATVRLKYACLITCEAAVKDASGTVVELKCRWDPTTIGGKTTSSSSKPSGTIHWVSAESATPVEIRSFDALFTVDDPSSLATNEDFLKALNPRSRVVTKGFVENVALDAKRFDKLTAFQFERMGFFIQDCKDSSDRTPVFNRIVTLRDTAVKSMKGAKLGQDDKRGAARKTRDGGLTWEDFRAMSDAEKDKLSKGQRKKLQKKMEKALKKMGIDPASETSAATKTKGSSCEKKKKAPTPAGEIDMSAFDIRVGHVVKAWKHPTMDRLFCEHVDLGGGGAPVTIATGLWGRVAQGDFENSRVLVVCNLPPKPLGGDFVSNGMVLAAEAADGKVELLRPPASAKLGERVRVPGCPGEPKSASWMKRKRKKWAKVLEEHVSTNASGEACYKGRPWGVGGGNVTAGGLKNASIK